MRKALIGVLLTTLLAPAVPTVTAVGPRTGYIVVLRAGHDSSSEGHRLTSADGGQLGTTYRHGLEGFSVTANDSEIGRIRRDSRVAYVEADVIVRIDAQSVPTGVGRIGATTNPSIDINGIDGRRANVDVAILDTGIDVTHPDLNVVGGVDCLGASCVAGGNDDNFHGTHVAGIVGALDNDIGTVGVAPGARLWAVKVLDSSGSGPLSAVLRGIDWIAAHSPKISVVNMSFGVQGFSQALFDSIQAAVNNGVAFAAAAGNLHLDTAGFSPASFGNVLAVSALADFDGLPGGLAPSGCTADIDDTLASFSNFGSVDIAAPGVCILSTIPTRLGSYGVLSGTSMASPAVAGALALLASGTRATNAADVSSMYQKVLSAGRSNWTDTSGDGVKEPLLDVSNPAVFAAVAAPCAVILSGPPVGWWTGDGSLAARVGAGLSGTAGFAHAEVGQGFALDGTSSLTWPTMPAISSGLTVEAWLEPANTGTVQAIVSRWDFPSTDDRARAFSLTLSPYGGLLWETDEPTLRRPLTLMADAPQLFDGFLHHVAATWDTNRATLYIDGAQVASAPSQGGTLNPNTGTSFRVGGQSHGGGSQFPYTGIIDEPTLWSRPLTPTEIAAIHSAADVGKC